MKGKAVNTIKFSAKGLNMLSGQLTIDASFKIATESVSAIDILPTFSLCNSYDKETSIQSNNDLFILDVLNSVQRVDISYNKSVITPDQVRSCPYMFLSRLLILSIHISNHLDLI